MSLSQRLHGQTDKPAETWTAEKYEVLIGRLKVLSKSQTALLKSYLHGKLATSVSIVNKAIDHLNKSSENDAKAKELRNALATLKLSDIEVDVTSTKVMLYEELALLRGAVDYYEITNTSGNKASPATVPANNSAAGGGGSGSSAADAARIQALDAENARLKNLLKAAQNELASAPPPLPAPSNGAPAAAAGGANAEEVKALRKDIADKNREIETLKEHSATKERQLKTQVDQLTRELSDNQSALRSESDATAKSGDTLRTEAAEARRIADAANRNTDNVKAELTELQNKYNVLRSELEESTKKERKLRSDLEEATAGDKNLRGEIDGLKRKEQTALAQWEEAKRAVQQSEAVLAQARSDAAAQLAAKTRELTEQSAQALKEQEERLEAEKEEMMEAMAQEVDEIEKTKAAELEAVGAERDKWHNKFTALQRVNYALVFGMKRITDGSKALVKDFNSLKNETKRDLQDMSANLRTLGTGSLLGRLKSVQEEIVTTTQKYRREMGERKRLHNMVQELKGNIRVYMRCRPPTTKEIEQFGNDSCCVSFPGPGEVKVFNEKNREKAWEFDEVFDVNSKQSDVYEDVSALVTSVMDGFNVCIFAYGQTGSGKTWTMSGPTDNRGVNTRALEELFSKARERSGEWNDAISVSLLEVYNEEIRDLLADGKSDEKLEVKMGEYGNHVPGLTNIQVDGIQTVLSLLERADRNRASATTNMNEHSSRSHMMLSVTVISEFKPTGATSRGKLNLVDLAGSERINKSGAVGQALKEAQNINKSLSALGDVIAARAQKTAHVPFRNSTLTFLLQDSLSQDSKTLMIVCVSPVLYNAEETFCSLNFAARVRTVELGKATKNTITSSGSATAPTASSSGKSSMPPLSKRPSVSSASPPPGR